LLRSKTRSSASVLARAGALVVLGVVAAACSSGGGASATAAAPSSAGGETVDVTLQEWAVVPAQDSAAGGAVTFQVMNKGPEDLHEFVVFKTDLGPRDLPTTDDGSVDEEGAGVELIGEIQEFDPGTSQSTTFDLAPGKYVFLCNLVEEDNGTLESHYQLGMSTAFTVE
jgi:uncharacterized cupredoxin-like copper-binding protein